MMNLDFLVNAVSMSGQQLMTLFDERNRRLFKGVTNDYLEEKALKELVIEEDLLSEKIIKKHIKEKTPNAKIYSEECDYLDELTQDDSQIKYIIDPLDGTHNYYFGLPYWGISVGVLDSKNNVIGGVIYIPAFGILLKNEGLNLPAKIHIDGKWQDCSTVIRTIDKALICYDNQFYKMGYNAIENYEKLTKKAFTTRITGSAVTDAAFIATGRVNARVFNRTNSYDIAAGMAIVRSSGGEVTNFSGKVTNVLSKQIIMSSGGVLHDSIINIINNNLTKGS